MTLDLAYRSGAAWNETHFNSPAFDAALDHASAILDPHERSKAMQAVEQILRDNAVMVQPYFPAPFTATAKNVHGYKLNPADYFDLFTVWLS
jgi:peptide/nickel transport system substrate-binding protein